MNRPALSAALPFLLAAAASASNDPRLPVQLPATFQPDMIVTPTSVRDGAGQPIPKREQ